MEKKRLTAGKTAAGKLAGIIFCSAAAAAAVVLIFVQAYFGGQMKTIDRYLTALERDDFDAYAACFPPEVAASVKPSDFETAKGIADCLGTREDFRAEASFRGRQKEYSGGAVKYTVFFDLDVYNNDEHKTMKNVSRTLVYRKGKWFILPNYMQTY